MPPTTSIPRFLLPQRGTIWLTRLSTPRSTLTTRNASHKAPKKATKPLILEKPTKFNPPSHGARLRKEAPRYPGPKLSEEEAAAQQSRKYPTMMPPEGSFSHWFLNNRSIHMWITLGTLFTLASTVFITNFKRNSPFADMLPAWNSLFTRPIVSIRAFFDVIKLDREHQSRETMERRAHKTDDIQKRAAYRKAHGLDQEKGFGGWEVKKVDGGVVEGSVGVAEVGEGGEVGEVGGQQVVSEKRQVKKWLGIW